MNDKKIEARMALHELIDYVLQFVPNKQFGSDMTTEETELYDIANKLDEAILKI